MRRFQEVVITDQTPLRSKEYPYGKSESELSKEDYAKVRRGTYLALRTLKSAKLAWEVGVAGFIENPEPMGDHVSLFELEEYGEFSKLPGVKIVDFDQCRHGAESAKPTRIMYWGMDLSRLKGRCNHPLQECTYVDMHNRSKTCWRSHPPIIKKKSGSDFATKAIGAYPSNMNRIIAEQVAAIRHKETAPALSATRLRKPDKVRFELGWRAAKKCYNNSGRDEREQVRFPKLQDKS